MKPEEWRWIYNTIEKVLLQDDYDLACAHCPYKSGVCKGKFCEDVKRKLYLKLNKGVK